MNAREIVVRNDLILVADGQSCGANENYNECGTQCPRTCADVGKPEKMCNHMCALGCFCVPGYVRKTDGNSPCVKETEC